MYSSLLQSRRIEEQQKEKMDPETKEPRFTNSKQGFQQTIDYIFYTGIVDIVYAIVLFCKKNKNKNYEFFFPNIIFFLSTSSLIGNCSMALVTKAMGLLSELVIMLLFPLFLYEFAR